MKKEKIVAMWLSLCLLVGNVGIIYSHNEKKAKAAETEGASLTVEATQKTGALKHGASGFLYGLGADQVPSTSLILGLKPNITAQKPPYGLQHPSGDTLEIADTFLQAGGSSVQIYCLDIHANWPYEDESKDMEAYEEKIKTMVKQVKAAGLSDKVVYVPFNEPEGQQYKSIWSGDNQQFLEDWNYIYKVIKKADPKAKIAGSNCCVYQAKHTEEFVTYCAENNCIPDQFTWHALSRSELGSLKDNLKKYRALEKKYWIDAGKVSTEREVVINEYADFTDLGVPGRLIPYVSILEDSKVSGCLAYWHISNNLDDLAADNNEPNGAYWLYKWYGDMSGETLKTAVSGEEEKKFSGVAAIDDAKKSASVIFGGVNGKQTVKVEKLNETESFAKAKKVTVKMERTNFTGINGASDEPDLLYETVCPVAADGSLTVSIDDAVESAGYRMTISQAKDSDSEGIVKEGAWKGLYEAEDGVLEGKAKKKGKDSKYACSGTGQVQLQRTGDQVTMTVNVPEEGFYKMDMVYGAATGNSSWSVNNNNPKNAKAFFYMDGLEKKEMTLENTLTWYMSGMHTEYQYMRKGEHEITIQAGKSEGMCSVDCIYLTYVGKEGKDVNNRRYVKEYEAEQSDFNQLNGQKSSTVKTMTTRSDYSGAGYVTGLTTKVSEGGGIRIYSCVNDDGIYKVTVRYAADEAGSIGCYLGNSVEELNHKVEDLPIENTNGEWKEKDIYLYLQRGMNIFDFDCSSESAAIDKVRIEQRQNGGNTTIVEAEDLEKTGAVDVKENSYASGGKYVAGFSADSKKANAVTLTYEAEEAGTYAIAIYQSNGELFGNHSYNAQMVDRYVTLEVNGKAPKQVYFRNTYCDESFKSKVITMDLQKGENKIVIYNDDKRTLQNGIGGVNVCENRTPNLDKFEITPLLVDSSKSELKEMEVPEKDLSTPKPKPTAVPTAVPTATPSNAADGKQPSKPAVNTNGNHQTLKKGDKVTVGKITYQVTNAVKKEAAVVKAAKVKKAVIKATVKIKGVSCKVTKIAKNAFAKNKKLKQVVIGKNIVTIEKKAFYKDRALTKIEFKGSKLKSVGKQAFSGVSQKAVVKAPKKDKKTILKKCKQGGLKR